MKAIINLSPALVLPLPPYLSSCFCQRQETDWLVFVLFDGLSEDRALNTDEPDLEQ